MAELLTPQEVFFTAFEPKVQNRYVMYLEGIPAYLIKTMQKPTLQFGEIVLDHINVKKKLKDLNPMVHSGCNYVGKRK